MRALIFYFLLSVSPLLSFASDNYKADLHSSRNRISDEEISRVVDSVMNRLSTREKIAQLMIIEFCSKDRPALKSLQDRLISKEKIGGVIVMNDHLVPAIKRLNRMHDLAPIPLLVTIDGEWGASMRYPELLFFPRQMQLGALSSDSLVYEIGKAIGKECADLYHHVNFVPDIDINNNPENPVINTRSFGENKEKVAEYGLAYLRGMKEYGIYGSAKHFPGHGDTNVDSHKALPSLPFTKGRLDSLELYPFKRFIENGVDMVMVGHLEIPSLDSTRTPASISKTIITDFLRGELGYNGIVITDALNMKGVSEFLPKSKIPLEALKAGVDILLMPEDVEASITEIEKALKRGEISLDDITTRLRKVLRLKVEAGLFRKSYNPFINTANLEERMVKDSNNELIFKAAEGSMTVVINERPSSGASMPILPLNPTSGMKLGYIGYKGEKFGKEFAQNLLRYANVDTLILRGDLSLEQLKRSAAAMDLCDAIIVGIHDTDSRPHKNFGLDSLHFDFLADLALRKDIILVYMGSPYALNRIKGYTNFKAYVVGYANTLANNCAAAQLLFGAIPAQGTLPVGAGIYKEGHSLRYPKWALSYDNVYKNREFTLSQGKVYGDYILKHSKANKVEAHVATDTLFHNEQISLGEMAPLLVQLPIIANLIDKGRFRITSTLGDLIKGMPSEHSRLLISDILMHRSGLPAVGDDLTFEGLSKLHLNSKPILEFSQANILYLNMVIKELLGDQGVEESLAQFYHMAGMNNTKVLQRGNSYDVVTTLDDIAKYLFILSNGGTSYGKRLFAASTANFLQMLLTYYSANSDGFTIMKSLPTGDFTFYYR